ncbi:MAG: protease inhibitor I42 family protein [Chloroflexota bacterium]
MNIKSLIYCPFLLVLLLTGCSTQSVQHASTQTVLATQTVEGSQKEGPVVSLSEEQNGGQVALIVNDQFQVLLDGNPTTGYTWEPDNLDSVLLQQQGESTYTSKSKLKGSPGKFILIFKALQPGVTKLRLIYHRTFEKNTAPERIFEVTLDIQK